MAHSLILFGVAGIGFRYVRQFQKPETVPVSA